MSSLKNNGKKLIRLYKKNIFLKIAILLFIIYIAFVMVQQQANLKQKQEQLKDLNQQITIQSLENEEMKAMLNVDINEEHIEKKAREKLDYSFTDEQVFIGIAGN